MDWARTAGGDVNRFNLAQEPLVFAENEVARAFLHAAGQEGLPVTLVDGATVLTGRYPSRDAEIAGSGPAQAAEQYRERIVGPVRGLLPAAEVASIQEQLPGACTIEIASFNEFTDLLTDAAWTAEYDHIIFDTAPTGHTIRLLQLPGSWTDFLTNGKGDASCLGPLSGLEKQRAVYAEAVQALSDPERTRLVLVARAQQSTLQEAARTHVELAGIGMAGWTTWRSPGSIPPSKSRATPTRSCEPRAHTWMARNKFVVMDTSPTGHTLLLLDTAGSYHREVERQMGGTRHFTTPMMKLQDPQQKKVILVTLAETTPVLEATESQEDLRGCTRGFRRLAPRLSLEITR